MTRSAVPPKSNATPSWQECLDAGMTAREAAEARGCEPNTAHNWAYKNGCKFKKVGKSGKALKSERLRAVEARPPVQRFAPVSEMDRILNEAFATVFGDRWEGPK